jgi:diamine N-acetyltransferase
MTPTLRLGTTDDISLLVELMSDFYAESGYEAENERAARAFAELIEDERAGRVWIIETEFEVVGYVVMTLGYSMEYGGRDAFIDDLFIRPAFRASGYGTAALAEVRAEAVSLGVRALHLEVGRDNESAQALYRRAGFVDTDRQLLTLRLADPTHVEA